MTDDDDPSEAEVHELTKLMLDVGMEAQTAAMRALVEVVEEHVGVDPRDRAKVIGLAGAIAFTQWRLDAVMQAITNAYPQYGALIGGARDAAAATFGKGFEDHARDTARKFNVPYPTEETVQ